MPNMEVNMFKDIRRLNITGGEFTMNNGTSPSPSYGPTYNAPVVNHVHGTQSYGPTYHPPPPSPHYGYGPPSLPRQQQQFKGNGSSLNQYPHPENQDQGYGSYRPQHRKMTTDPYIAGNSDMNRDEPYGRSYTSGQGRSYTAPVPNMGSQIPRSVYAQHGNGSYTHSMEDPDIQEMTSENWKKFRSQMKMVKEMNSNSDEDSEEEGLTRPQPHNSHANNRRQTQPQTQNNSRIPQRAGDPYLPQASGNAPQVSRESSSEPLDDPMVSDEDDSQRPGTYVDNRIYTTNMNSNNVKNKSVFDSNNDYSTRTNIVRNNAAKNKSEAVKK